MISGQKSSNPRRAVIVFAFAIAVGLFPLAAQARQTGNDSWRTLDTSSLTAPSGRGSGVLGDFDGDQRPDVALAQPHGVFNGAYRYRVDVHLSADLNTTFDVDYRASGGLHISARDVDGDRDLDLVITSEFGREPVGIWINDGHGAFTQGQAEAYLGSIWQETDRAFEAPCRPAGAVIAAGIPAGSWMAEPAVVAALLFSRNTASGSITDRPALNTLNLGSPLRAPPLS